MASWAVKRKILYVSIFFAVFFIIAAVIFSSTFFKPATCRDNKQNQGETGIDCGGPCQLLCKTETREPIVRWQRFFRASPGVYSAVAYVENPNPHSVAYAVPYSFRIYDAKNVLITERKGTTSIAPTGITPVFEGGITTGERLPSYVSFEFVGRPVWLSRSTQAPNITVSNQKLNLNTATPTFEAVISNPTLLAIPKFDVVAVFFNANGTAFAASKTVVDRLEGGQKAPVTFSWREPFTEQAVKIDVIPRLFPDQHY